MGVFNAGIGATWKSVRVKGECVYFVNGGVSLGPYSKRRKNINNRRKYRDNISFFP